MACHVARMVCITGVCMQSAQECMRPVERKKEVSNLGHYVKRDSMIYAGVLVLLGQ